MPAGAQIDVQRVSDQSKHRSVRPASKAIEVKPAEDEPDEQAELLREGLALFHSNGDAVTGWRQRERRRRLLRDEEVNR